MQKLEAAIIQTNLVWENPEQNRKNLEKKILAISKVIHLIVLPEMFTTGFTMNAYSNAENMNGKTVTWMKRIAKNKNCAITGSIIISENNQFFNRLLFVYPLGEVVYYNKRHTFTLAGEHQVYTSGEKQLIIHYRGWRICPFICYDLRFPVWSRNTENYDVLLYIANWPKQRITAWNSLLQARAIENMSYVIGVNRVGQDANGYEYTGNSAFIDCLGTVINNFDDGKNHIEVVTLDKNFQEKHRKKLPFLKDKDHFKIKN